MKLCNFASLDPAQQARGIKGLSAASRADAALFDEFSNNWVSLAAESEEARERLKANFKPLGTVERNAELVGPTEVSRAIKVRRVQGLFRATVLASYDFTCALSGINIPDLLVASHIIPWAQDESQRLNPRNGIALSALHDRAFDRGLITLDHTLTVVVSKRLRVAAPSEIHRIALVQLEGRRMRLPSRFEPDLKAIAWHREHIFVQ